MAATSSMMNSVLVAFQEVQGGFMQEALLLVIFGVSFTAWRHLQPRRMRKPKSIDYDTDQKVQDQSRKLVPKACAIDKDDPSVKEKVKMGQAEMLKLMEKNEFTRALNQYRAYERSGHDIFFGEELFSAFVRSATRCGKLDVTDRMLRTMKRAGIAPSVEFWQNTMKLMSSRKHFGVCLLAYDLWPRQCPADKTVFSCLINAALELGTADRTRPLLEKYMQAELAAKDYVLVFRCYVLLGDADAAEALLRKLGSQATPLMLNLTLSIFVSHKEVERAYTLLQEAHALEAGQYQPIVDVVSYNTIMKGFVADKNRLRCLDCLRGLVEKKLEPDEITLNALLDVCVAENDSAIANEIGDALLNGSGQKRKMTSSMLTTFVKGFIRAGSLPKALAVYAEMTRRDTSIVDLITCSVLIKALVDQHRLDEALTLVEDMKAKGLRVDDIVLTHLLEGCRHVSDHKRGMELFNEAVKDGVTISDVTMVTLLKLHGKCGAHREAFDLVENSESLYGVKLSVIHYTCLISGCLRTKNYDKAWEAFQWMLVRNVEPDVTTLTTILPSIVASKQWENVCLAVTRTLQQRKVLRKANDGLVESLNHALAQMRASSCPMKAISEIQALMQEAGISLSAKNTRC